MTATIQLQAQSELNAYVESQAQAIAPERHHLYCTHPNAIRYPHHTYRAIAQIAHKSGKQATADVVVINPSKAAIDKCLDTVLGAGWHTVSFQWADTSF